MVSGLVETVHSLSTIIRRLHYLLKDIYRNVSKHDGKHPINNLEEKGLIRRNLSLYKRLSDNMTSAFLDVIRRDGRDLQRTAREKPEYLPYVLKTYGEFDSILNELVSESHTSIKTSIYLRQKAKHLRALNYKLKQQTIKEARKRLR